ncbi:hypothetical protein PEPS_27540 (plasmid) [Persicobacter psychrovividus]|uniref:Carboxypeptidase regulatory-like domain-containing protein n=2 Tax=Persicobacter psychrovividus TaxID=387638 RepID=A0ABM7VHM8_9BACT|nr:hypothetical protein PEPS_27540 [Persicobacter psychrovividus]
MEQNKEQLIISGQVVDENGTGVPGVSVVFPEERLFLSTDVKGHFFTVAQARKSRLNVKVIAQGYYLYEGTQRSKRGQLNFEKIIIRESKPGEYAPFCAKKRPSWWLRLVRMINKALIG